MFWVSSNMNNAWRCSALSTIDWNLCSQYDQILDDIKKKIKKTTKFYII